MTERRRREEAQGQPIAVRLRHLVYLVVALPLLVSVMAVGVLQLQSKQSDLLSRAIAPAFDANGQVLQTINGSFTSESFVAEAVTGTYFTGSGDYSMK